MSARQRKFAVRLQYLLVLYVIGQVIAPLFVDLPYPYWVGWIPIFAVIGIALARRWSVSRTMAAEPRAAREIAPPVTGRWSAMNSPADKVPSHGTHHLGQTYAIDIVAEPEGGERPAFAWAWPITRGNEAFPAFGAPLLAVVGNHIVLDLGEETYAVYAHVQHG